MESLRQVSANAGVRLGRVSLGALAAVGAVYLAASLAFIIPIAAAGWLLCSVVQGLLPASAPAHGGLSLKA